MKHGSALRCLPALLSSLLALVISFPLSARGQQWTPPTPEELAMTAQPEVPGAPAVYLYREETTDDNLHMFSIYVRLKVLTDRGKDLANVELPYTKVSGGGGYTVDDIRGRTIHADGTVIPFTGKPMQKMVEKNGDVKYMAKVFTLPDVQVGSILEYRYYLRYDENYYRSPDWYIQSDLYTRKAHYQWKPTGRTLITHERGGEMSNRIGWTPILPPGANIQETAITGNSMRDGDSLWFLSLDVHDISPVPEEELMPPIKSFTYRVLFYYTHYKSQDEFWKNEGAGWSKTLDRFVGPGPVVKSRVQSLTASGDTQEQKLRKLYAAVMELENTSFTRERNRAEEKANGLSQIKTTDDVLERKRGNRDEITALFVAMARAAGMRAYMMGVTDRDRSIFSQDYLSMRQLDDDLAIVVVDGKEQFFDPGSRYAAYGHLAWNHTYCNGVRQTDGGSALAVTPGEPFTASKVLRVANLKMDQQGVVTGAVKLTYIGNPALRWRQTALTGDETSLKRELKSAAERMLPGGMEIEIASIDKLAEYEEPLVVTVNVKGAIGSPTGRRLLIPASLFEGNTRPLFSHEKRELPVYFNYAEVVQDAVRINFPASFAVESLPAGGKEKLQSAAAYTLTTEKTPTSVTVRRDYALGQFGFLPKEYPDLRAFYAKMESKDQEPIVLTRGEGGEAKPSGQ